MGSVANVGSSLRSHSLFNMQGLSQQGGYLCGPNANFWVERWFQDCVYTPQQTVAFFVGLSSLFFWLVAQCPQFISNFMRQSADALSPWFLVQWLTGDLFNLLGCLLTGDQLATQTMTASYFIFSDCLILSQYVYYQIRNQKKMYSSDSADTLDKPRYEYLAGEKNTSNRAVEAIQEEAAELTFHKGNSRNSSEHLCSGKHDRNCDIQSMHNGYMLKHALLHGKWGERNLYQDVTCKLTPLVASGESSTQHPAVFQVPNVTQFINNKGYSNNSTVKHHLEQYVGQTDPVLSKHCRVQTVDAKRFLYSQVDLKLEHSKMHEQNHRLKRVVLEYGLEHGPLTVSRFTGKHSHRVNDSHLGHLSSKLGHNKIQVPRMKTCARALLCLFGVMALGSPSWYSFQSAHTGEIDNGHGFVLGRRSLKAFQEEKEVPWFLSHYGRAPAFLLFGRSFTFVGKRLMSMDTASDWWTKMFGLFLGWISSGLYLGSRISQIIKNKQRRSAEGFSLLMVMCTILANLSYGLSIIMRESSWQDLIGKAPWLIGSLGTIFLDVTLFVQAHYFSWCSGKKILNERTPLLD